MKKLITMIGMGALLCLAPSCNKSKIMPQETAAVNTEAQRAPAPQDPFVQVNTSFYVMLASTFCSNPEKQYTSLMLDIKGVRVFNPATGWQDLKTVPAGWDLVYSQQGIAPGWNITERMPVNPGKITQMAITFGNNNKLVVNNSPASCFKLGAQEVVVDVRGEIKEGAVNELLVGIDICGNIGVQSVPDMDPCYVLKPVLHFERLSQKMIK